MSPYLFVMLLFQMVKYSVTERAQCAAWFEWTKSVVEVQRKFRAEYGKNSEVPAGKSIRQWHANLMTTGSVQDVKRKRSLSSRTDENVQRVAQHFEADPHASTRRAALALAISRRTIQRILQDLRWHPYKVQVVQRLHEEDKENRLQFAQQELARINADPMHLAELTWSDEAHFHLDGGVNRHNCRYWAPENPQWVVEQSLHSPRTTAWAAIWQGGVYGPFFFDGTVNKERYLQMLQKEFWPVVVAEGRANEILFMQDGAPPHWGTTVREWLSEQMPQRWMGRDSPNLPWPPRSPDLTPCDFFVWGFVKSKVYVTRPANIPELKDRIRAAFAEITVEMRKKAALAYRERLEQVIENDGGHVEVHN